MDDSGTEERVNGVVPAEVAGVVARFVAVTLESKDALEAQLRPWRVAERIDGEHEVGESSLRRGEEDVAGTSGEVWHAGGMVGELDELIHSYDILCSN